MQSFESDQLARSLHEALRRLEEALDYLRDAGRQLVGEVARLSQLIDRMEASLAPAPAGPAPAEREPLPLPVHEPAFEPGEGPVRIIIAAVPGFQGLMDVQRALSRLAGVEGASVKRYQNGEASLELVLARALAPSRIVEALEQTTGQQLLIEEARPEEQLLRLRFLDGDA